MLVLELGLITQETGLFIETFVRITTDLYVYSRAWSARMPAKSGEQKYKQVSALRSEMVCCTQTSFSGLDWS